jgi:hypothetical protein
MLQNYVMNNVHDSISLIEEYLDTNNAEYQAHGNNIEVYPLEKSVIRIKFNDSKIEIISQSKEYSFDKIDNNFFSQLQNLIS